MSAGGEPSTAARQGRSTEPHDSAAACNRDAWPPLEAGGTILDQIVFWRRRDLADAVLLRSRNEVMELARNSPAPRGFRLALDRPDVALIAEIKRSSPSAGIIRRNVAPVGIGQSYLAGGAAAISILTETRHFGGSLADLEAVRSAVPLPVLRKDFILDPYDVHEARAAGADAVLLIAAILEEEQLTALYRTVNDLGMDALVEVHTEEEMAMARRLGADLVGINNRDLKSFETRLDVTETLAAAAPRGALVAALSGIATRADVARMAAAGAAAVLVGESLMRQDDTVAAVEALTGVPRSRT